ncbi:hypothetical protein SPRG_20351 [Saprolegnia parasitica CBS 223.65]|uniref:Methyltransferase domain-containing protein n=1 Tax=Saprolegnia parasitica (strain CBS 223.65) TaxID=695850 RepID=A0A067CB00_SAPPC|nr:hypothetical protein SPRG_20351 [Saprolegnia parasitica CBS 223.65]KDO27954.1 hypothetical protein SPRG_20351 [Saprolegnia parasitica CBS 223.65]|eukprot:XP_012201467.1 hypothetical protein SPRG_20351 [Saprolegnia parasitica CBS 223.65]
MNWDAKFEALTECRFFDWYLSFAQLAPYLTPLLATYGLECEILIPGCGLSDVGVELHASGYHNITNLDSSPVAIARMTATQAVERATDAMEFVCLDVFQVPTAIPPSTFDVILDKGLLDALLCAPTSNVEDTFTYLRAMYQVLRRGGTFVLVTHSPTRLAYLEHAQFSWKLIRQSSVTHNARSYHLFCCVKSHL